MIISRLNRTRSIHAIIVTISLFFLSTFSAHANEIVSVKKDNVNVRTGPSTDNPVFMELFKGYPLKVIGKKGEWLKVSDFEKDTGWIHSALVEKGNTVIVNATNHVNLRSEPSTKKGKDSVVTGVERGVVLTKVTRQGNWYKVRHSSGYEGWINRNYLWP